MSKQVIRRFFFGNILCSTVFFGCAASLSFVPFPEGITPPHTVAVLPFDNQTNSVPGALYLREVFNENLGRKGYVARPLSEVDQLLSDRFGISLGGQITDDLIPEIGKALEVDAVIRGTVQKFGTVLIHDEVEATFALYETRAGNKLWEYHGHAQRESEFSQLARHDPLIAASVMLGGALIERGLGKPLYRVVHQFFAKLLAQMPNGVEPSQRGG